MGRRLAYVIGAVVMAAGVAMVPAAGVSAIYQEWNESLWILVAAGITVAAGYVSWRIFGRQGIVTTKEGFATVGLAWFALAFFGTLPYLLTGSIGNLTDAFFETASGFTTTGASVIPDPAVLSKGILFWRSLTQWLGGMGIIVLSLAILPILGVGGVQLARAESPGPELDRLTPRIRDTAKRLWYVYAGITLIQVIFLVAGEMDLFQAINHAFTTMSTGGFSTEARSVGAFGLYTQWVIIFFMFVAGVSFALHYRALTKPGSYFKNTEFLLYTTMVIGAVVIIGGGIWGDSDFVQTLTDSVFTSVALITTTGFGNADFGQWESGLQIFIVGLMFLGGMAGSTAGGIKTYRIGVLTKAASADLRRLVHPRGVFLTRFGKDVVPDPIVESVQSFFLFFMFLFMTGTFAMGFIASTLPGAELDLVTSASAVASALGNIGPGLGDVGPTSNYLGIPWPGKWLLSFLMMAGRLEIFPVLLLFTRELWRRS
ncbi:MAG TPA: TrkH family potassium uptake protein [Actinobacteria bacterium]|nr:TrkH family potassium uptake protein [Actinomycetota bacterium]